MGVAQTNRREWLRDGAMVVVGGDNASGGWANILQRVQCSGRRVEEESTHSAPQPPQSLPKRCILQTVDPETKMEGEASARKPELTAGLGEHFSLLGV